MAINIPFNRTLEEAATRDDVPAIIARDRFAKRWDRANAVRTSACLAAAMALGWAAVAS